jgi:hypothetical protein
MRRKRPHPDYVAGDICLTLTCGNAADSETLFCQDCVPTEPGLLTRIIRIPFVWLAEILGV